MKPWTTPVKEIAPNAIIVDIDGTLAIHQGRSPYDYTRVSEDGFNYHLWFLIKDQNVILLTGREGKEQVRKDTITWLEKYTDYTEDFFDHRLFMRAAGDQRKDAIVKAEIYDNEIEPHYNIIAVFEDRDRNVAMWRDMGLFCCQVNYGDF